MHERHPWAPLLFVVLMACGSSQATPAGGAEAAPGDAAPADGAQPVEGGADAAAAAGAASAAATAGPAAEPAGEKEGPKDENALVLALSFKGKDLDDAGRAAMEKEALGIVRKSAKLALSDKGLKSPRHVTATLTAEPVTGDKKGFTIKLGMTGVTTNGNCPLFDLNQKLSMEGGKKENAADVAELRKAALAALFDELEQKAPTMKPNANCTPYK